MLLNSYVSCAEPTDHVELDFVVSDFKDKDRVLYLHYPRVVQAYLRLFWELNGPHYPLHLQAVQE